MMVIFQTVNTLFGCDMEEREKGGGEVNVVVSGGFFRAAGTSRKQEELYTKKKILSL